jgi:hypothetical protein
LESWKQIFWSGRYQIISPEASELKEFFGYHGTNGMRACVVSRSFATTISKVTRHGIFAAWNKRLTKYIFCHFD